MKTNYTHHACNKYMRPMTSNHMSTVFYHSWDGVDFVTEHWNTNVAIIARLLILETNQENKSKWNDKKKEK